MRFKRVSRSERRSVSERNTCFLIDDGWDDYNYKTLFDLIYFDSQGKRNDLGSLKIMRRGMDHGRVEVKEEFARLTATYASLGTDQSYYENVTALGNEIANEIFRALRDVAWNADLYTAFKTERPFELSLMRGLRRLDVRKFSDIAHNRAELTPYHFVYKFADLQTLPLDFRVVPRTLPPSNIQTIIGRNGVGKTRLLKSIITLLCDGQDPITGSSLNFYTDEDEDDGSTFANLVNVAFSAFDDMSFPTSPNGTRTGIKMSYIGLRRPLSAPKLKENQLGEIPVVTSLAKQPKTQLKSLVDLTNEFSESLMTCIRSSKRELWIEIMSILASDPIFASMELSDLPHQDENEAIISSKRIFGLASSGHKIVLLCLTRLVELVEERTLVLIGGWPIHALFSAHEWGASAAHHQFSPVDVARELH